MKVKKTVLWSVLAWLSGFVGIASALAIGGYAVWRIRGGHSLNEIVRVCLFNKITFHVSMKRFIVAAAGACLCIIFAIIFKCIGKAIYRKRLEKAVEAARLANSNKGVFGLTPEMQEQVADVAKKLIPVVATVAVACVVAGAVKKSQKKNNQAGLIQTTRYYPC